MDKATSRAWPNADGGKEQERYGCIYYFIRVQEPGRQARADNGLANPRLLIAEVSFRRCLFLFPLTTELRERCRMLSAT